MANASRLEKLLAQILHSDEPAEILNATSTAQLQSLTKLLQTHSEIFGVAMPLSIDVAQASREALIKQILRISDLVPTAGGGVNSADFTETGASKGLWESR